VFIEIPDHTIGVAPGERMPFRIHIAGAAPQPAEVRIMISDELGRARGHLGDSFEIASAEHVHDMMWERARAGQPGTYRLEVQVCLRNSRRRIITSRLFEMVAPGHAKPGVLRPVERSGPIRCEHEFPRPDVEALGAVFDAAHAEVQAVANGDGSYGAGYGPTTRESSADKAALALNRPLVRHTASAVMAYLVACKSGRGELYADFARAGLDYLMARDQHKSGAFIWWGTAEGVVNDSDSFYATGYGALALVMGHEILQHPGALDAARRAGDWTLDKPLTGNVNYDLFAMWFLPKLFRLTGDERYLDSAIRRTEGAAFDGQNPGGAWPGHNLSFGYHGIILLGLATLYRELPKAHAFRSRLEERLIMAANFGASLISKEGSCYFGWEYNRGGFHVDWQGRPAGLRTVPHGPFSAAWPILDECLDVDDRIMAGLCYATCDAYKRYCDGTDRNWGMEGQDKTACRGWSDIPTTSTLWSGASLLAWLGEKQSRGAAQKRPGAQEGRG